MTTAREIVVFFTGGTIGMTQDPEVRGVTPGGRFDRLLHELAPFGDAASLRPVAWSDRPSPHMTPEDMFRLARDVETALRPPQVAGAVVLHGTDVLVESAYMADLAVDSDKPVVFTGSMRYYAESGYDGVRNLINAVRACLLPLPPGTGVCILMTDRVFRARETVKTNSLNVDAFESREAGIVGYVAGESVVLSGRPLAAAPRRLLRPAAIEPNVPLMTAFTGIDRAALDMLKEYGIQGIVIEAFGAGNVPPATPWNRW